MQIFRSIFLSWWAKHEAEILHSSFEIAFFCQLIFCFIQRSWVPLNLILVGFNIGPQNALSKVLYNPSKLSDYVITAENN